jgi:hypothetical protein
VNCHRKIAAVLLFLRRYTEYAGPVQDTYDTIVTNSLSLLRGMSLDERASKLRDQFKSREVFHLLSGAVRCAVLPLS